MTGGSIPESKAGGPPLLDCPLPFIQYNGSYLPKFEAVSSNCNARTRHAVKKRDPHNIDTWWIFLLIFVLIGEMARCVSYIIWHIVIFPSLSRSELESVFLLSDIQTKFLKLFVMSSMPSTYQQIPSSLVWPPKLLVVLLLSFLPTPTLYAQVFSSAHVLNLPGPEVFF